MSSPLQKAVAVAGMMDRMPGSMFKGCMGCR
jgi:hypothetical protein